MLRTQGLGVLVFGWLICGPSAVCAQTSSTLGDIIIGITAANMPGLTSPSSQIALSSSVRPIKPTLVVPNNVAAAIDFSKSLGRFDSIPSSSSMASSGGTFDTATKEILSEIEFSTKALTDDERSRLREAERLLYIGTDKTPSPVYARYQEFERSYKELTDQLTNETNPAARITIQNKIAQTDRDWQLFGQRDELKSALLQVESLAPTDSKSLLDQWRQLVADYRPFSAQSLSLEMAASNWLRVSASNADLASLDVTIKGSGSTIDLPGVQRISLDFTIVPVVRSPLQAPLMLDHTWRLHSGAVLSDGNPASDEPSELLPRVTSAVVLVKNLELSFADDLPNGALNILSGTHAGDVGGIGFGGTGQPPAAFQARSITIVGPVIVGAVVDELAKIPSPNVDREWP